MRVLLAGGGTAGHINPALAIASSILEKEPDASILFAGTPDGMEATLVRKAGYDFTPIQVKGFWRGFAPEDIVHNIKAVHYLIHSPRTAARIIRDFKPDIVIGTGGYVSGPVVRMAQKKGIPTLIHEQNAYPGVTNKLLAKKADVVALAVKEAESRLEINGKTIITGNPIRESVLHKDRAEARRELGFSDGEICILSFGGSLGATMINRIAADLIEWHKDRDGIHHIHGFGQLGVKVFPDLLKERNLNLSDIPHVDVRQYIDNMDTCMAAADIVISRSGAITLSELEAAGKASILIPSPTVSENHQYHNAMVLQNHEAAFVVEEKNYDRDELIRLVADLCDHPDKIRTLSENARKLAVLDTGDQIYREVRELVK